MYWTTDAGWWNNQATSITRVTSGAKFGNAYAVVTTPGIAVNEGVRCNDISVTAGSPTPSVFG